VDLPAVLLGLLEDDSPSETPAADGSVAGYASHRQAWFAPLLGPVRVPDRRLGELGRNVTGQSPLPVCAVNTTGAGGLVALGTRALVGLQLVAVESAVRDLDDVAGNAARIVTAAATLGDTVDVYVELPDAPGWERAVAVVEAAGLRCAVRVDDSTPPVRLVERLRGLVESDVAFKTIGSPVEIVGLLVAIEALIEGVDPGEAAQLLARGEASARVLLGWEDGVAARVRRRLCLVSCASVPKTVRELVRAGLLSPT